MKYCKPGLHHLNDTKANAQCIDGSTAGDDGTCNAGPGVTGGQRCSAGVAAGGLCSPGTAPGQNCNTGTGVGSTCFAGPSPIATGY